MKEKLSTSPGNCGVNGVKVGETLTDEADGNAELRPISKDQKRSDLRSAKCRDETAPS